MLLTSVFVVVCAILCATGVFAQGPSISSTEWEYRQIDNSLIEHENRIKALVSENLPKVQALLDEFTPNTKLKLLVDALTKLRNRLTDYSSISSYSSDNVSLTCNEIVAKIMNFTYDNARCIKIKFNNDVNSTLLYVESGSLNIAYVANYYNLNDIQRLNVSSCVNNLVIVVNEFNQHSVTLAMAIYKYTRLYIDLLLYKKNFCNCPSQLSPNSTSALESVDNNLKQIQESVDSREKNITTKSGDVLNKISAISADLRKSSAFIFISTNMDSLANLCKGYLQLTSSDLINSTTNCDDAARKVAFLQYKFEQYYQMNVEATMNSTFVCFYLNNLNAFYAANYNQLSEAQKAGTKAVIDSTKSLVDEFVQYILSLSTSLVKLTLELFYAKIARYGSCNCTEAPTSTVGLLSELSVMMILELVLIFFSFEISFFFEK